MRLDEIFDGPKMIDIEEDFGSVQGYAVDSNREQLENWMTGFHVYDEVLIKDIRSRFKRIAILKNLNVNEDERNNGYGNDLFEAFKEQAIYADADAILLIADTGEVNEFDLVKWYERLGFECLTNGSDPLMLLVLNETITESAEPKSKLLFHGTTVGKANQIIRNGFVPRGGKSKTFGKAVYFSDKPIGTRMYDRGAILAYRIRSDAKVISLQEFQKNGRGDADIVAGGRSFYPEEQEFAVFNQQALEFVGWFNKMTNKIDKHEPKYPNDFYHSWDYDNETPISERAKVKLSTSGDEIGAWVHDHGKPEKTVILPINKLDVNEPDSKFDDTENAANLKSIQKALKKGKTLPPILVRRVGMRFQVMDGHHRFKAYRSLGMKKIPARIVHASNITEGAKRSVLYHGTSMESLAEILADGHVNASPPDDYDENGYDGVSLTSSLSIAEKFAKEAKDRDEYWNSPVNDEVVLVFNADAIRKTIGASRVTWDGSRQEREHRTHGPIINVLKYLIQIRLDVNSLQWWINAFEEEGETRLAEALKSIPMNLVQNRVNERAKVNITETGNFNIISTPDIIKYIRKNHGEKLHQDYVDHLNTFSGFVLKNIPVNSINANLPHLDKTKVEQYKQLDFSKSPPIVMGDGHILDGYHRVNVAKTLKIPTIKGYVGMKKTSNITEVIKMPPTTGSSSGMAQWAYDDAIAKHAQTLPALQTGVETKVFKIGNLIRIFVMHGDTPVLYLGLTEFLDGYKSGVVSVEPDARGKGLALKVYVAASQQYRKPIYSDTTQTDDSRLGIWQKLIQLYPQNVVGYDQANRKNLPITMSAQGPIVNTNQPVYTKLKNPDRSITPNTRQRTRLLKLLPILAESITENADPNIEKIAKLFQDQFDEEHVAAGPASRFSWSFDPNFPIDRIAGKRELLRYFEADKQTWAEDGDPHRFDDMNEGIHTPVILVRIGGLAYLWDGNHRVGASILNGRTTIPAYVGVPKKGINESKASSYLQSLSTIDQQERNKYAAFVKANGDDWDKGAQLYAKKFNRSPDDVFGEVARNKEFIAKAKNFDFDNFSEQDWNNFWIVCQHCDFDRAFQKWALGIIKQYEGINDHYKYLYDRISCGCTGTQKYGTQDICNQT